MGDILDEGSLRTHKGQKWEAARCSATFVWISARSRASIRVIRAPRAGAGNAPDCEWTSPPSRKAMIVEIECMFAMAASCCSASVSTLACTISRCACDDLSKTWVKARHGQHHDARKSTSTMPLPTMVDPKSAIVRLFVAMFSAPVARPE